MEKFIFIRHGETDWNLQGKFQGQTDTLLNEVGIEQAARASHVVSHLGIDLIISSKLKRAIKTAEIINSGGLVDILYEINELNECQNEETARIIYSGLGRNKFPNFRYNIEAPERPEDFFKRVKNGIEKISQLKARLPLIIAHGGTYWAICELLEISPKDIPNCIPIEFKKQNGSWKQKTLWN